jgi:neopullulanase
VDPEAYLVAEIWHEKPSDVQGDMYDALMNYPLAEAIVSFTGAGRLDRRVLDQHFNLSSTVRDDDAAAFATRLERAMTVYHPNVTAVQLNLLDSHDTPRFLSLVGGDTDALRLATLIQMTLPGAPSIYYGDEIGLSGELDPFSRGSFPWDHPDRWDRAVLADMSGAAAIRHAVPALRHGSFRVVATAEGTIAFVRALGDAAALVLVNAGDRPCRLTLELPELDGRVLAARRWTGRPAGVVPDALPVSGGRADLQIPARDGVIYTVG